MQAGRVTMTRLAAELGVSVSTISNAYNRPEKLSPALRNRVFSVAAALGYVGPDPIARSLRRRRTDGVGVVFTDDLPFVFTDPASAGFLSGVAAELAKYGQHLILLPAGTPDRRQRASVDQVALDGVILHSLPRGEATLELLRRRQTPTVLVDQPGPLPDISWVGLDESAGMRELGRHLATLGHTRIGFITSRLGTAPYDGPASSARVARSHFTIPRDRIRGFEDGLGHRVVIEERWATTQHDGAAAAAALMHRRPDLSAIACVADIYALGVLRWAREHHIQIPHQLTVTGHDDIDAALPAGLTTVRQPLHQKGRIAAGTLQHLIREAAPATHRYLTTQIKRRESSGYQY